MKPEQITRHDDGTVTVIFETAQIQLPELLDQLVLAQRDACRHPRYDGHRTRWLFPGRNAGRPLASETFRRELVANGIHPGDSR
jgi:hypothetical protein